MDSGSDANLDVSRNSEIEVTVIPPGLQLPSDLVVVPNSEGITVLGVPVGSDQYIARILREKLQLAVSLAEALPGIRCCQIAALLLRFCLIPKMIYWWRCVQPSLVSSIAREFDSVVEQALHNVMSLNLPDPSGLEGQCLRLQESLPLKMGGIGLRKSAALCSLAFVPSFLTACQHSSFPPSLKSLIMLSIGNDSNTAPEGSGVITDFTNVWPSVRDLVKKVGPLLPTTKFPDFSDPLAILAAVRHKGALSQSSLSRLMDLKVSNDLLALLPDPEKARVMSCAGPYASSWLSVIPTAQSLRIIDANFRVAIAYRFGLHLPTAPLWGPTCCHTEAAPLDPQGRHFSSCYAATGLRSSRHNDLVKYWRRAMSCAGVVSVLEVAGVFGDTGQRPDIFVFRWPDPEGLSRAFDAVISDPSCPSHCKAAAVRPLATADKAEKLKVAKYGHLAKRYSFDFVPLSFETYGAWGKSAVKTLAQPWLACLGVPSKLVQVGVGVGSRVGLRNLSW